MLADSISWYASFDPIFSVLVGAPEVKGRGMGGVEGFVGSVMGAIGGEICDLCAVRPVDFTPGPEISVLSRFWGIGILPLRFLWGLRFGVMREMGIFGLVIWEVSGHWTVANGSAGDGGSLGFY
ncbi:hypothetical protein EJB05_27746, partial [Eragrostis curvula]